MSYNVHNPLPDNLSFNRRLIQNKKDTSLYSIFSLQGLIFVFLEIYNQPIDFYFQSYPTSCLLCYVDEVGCMSELILKTSHSTDSNFVRFQIRMIIKSK